MTNAGDNNSNDSNPPSSLSGMRDNTKGGNDALETRRLELLAGETLGDLTIEEQEELALLRSENDDQIAMELERTAAAVQLASMAGGYESMPGSLSTRIRSQADQFVSENREQPARQIANPVETNKPIRLQAREAFAWLACAAATTLLAFSYFDSQGPQELSLATQRSVLIERGGQDLIKVDWSPGTTPFDEDVSGDVVWDNEAQKGFMRFKNLPINDAAMQQYQLWIIDPLRDDEPIDGGVFNCNSTGEIVVPITAKLQVISPAAFAITVEKPGGVVVSTQENLPLLAAVQ